MSAIDSTPSSNGVARKSWAESWAHLRVNRLSPGHCRVTFDRPPNDTSAATMLAELDELIGLIEADADLNVVVFDSAHPDFYLPKDGTAGGAKWFDALVRLSRARAVSIVSIRGRTRGAGADFALACDLRFSSRESTVLARLLADQVDAAASRLERFDRETLARAKLDVDTHPSL